MCGYDKDAWTAVRACRMAAFGSLLMLAGRLVPPGLLLLLLSAALFGMGYYRKGPEDGK